MNELKKILEELPEELGNCEVVMSKDAEGNSYSPCVQVEDDGYCDDSSVYNIDSIYFDSHGYDGNCFDSKALWEDYKKAAFRVVVLCPMN